MVPVELGLGDTNGFLEIIIGQSGSQDLVADDKRHVRAELYRRDVLRTGAFRTPAFRIRHLLAFMQFLETATLDARRVEEQVFVAPGADESESLVRQPLDRAFRHLCISHSDCLD
jgi:hypothetical protein